MRLLQKRGTQKGIALLTVLLLLVLLSALALGLMYMSSTETLINTNFRNEQAYYFAAKAGMEEMRDRMMAANTNSINSSLPAGVPSLLGGNILYIINEGNLTANSVKNAIWSNAANNNYMDTELCHDGYTITGLTNSSVSDLPCTTVPTGTITTTTSQLNWKNTAAALPFRWSRISLKLNGTLPNHMVNSSLASTANVCWNGVYEIATTSACAVGTNPVYLITALAANNDANRPIRKMVQAEVALQPAQPFLWGMFATGTGCGAVNLSGNVATDSYTTAGGQTYSSSHTSTGGDVGSNGSVSANGSVTIGGSVGSTLYPGTNGACPGNAYSGPALVNNPANQITQIPGGAITIPTPVIANTTGPAESDPGTLSPGNYGDLTIKHGTTTLSAGVYNVNSITISANGVLAASGAVTINVVGNGNTSPIDLEGGGVSNPSGLASNLQINYAGTGSVKVVGGSTAYLVMYAPNAAVTLMGNADIYGSVIGNTINNGGTPGFHYDKNLKSPVPSNSYYSLISFRDLPY
jgi:Tfp pilus assembly protein PilX